MSLHSVCACGVQASSCPIHGTPAYMRVWTPDPRDARIAELEAEVQSLRLGLTGVANSLQVEEQSALRARWWARAWKAAARKWRARARLSRTDFARADQAADAWRAHYTETARRYLHLRTITKDLWRGGCDTLEAHDRQRAADARALRVERARVEHYRALYMMWMVMVPTEQADWTQRADAALRALRALGEEP